MLLQESVSCAHIESFDRPVTVLQIAVIISSFSSLIGASFMILTYLKIGTPGRVLSSMIATLAFADYGAALSNILYALLLLCAGQNISPCILPICYMQRMFYQFFVIASWMWTLCIALYICYSLVFRKEPENVFLASHIFAWSISFILNTFLSTWDGGVPATLFVASSGYCLPHWNPHVFFWFIPLCCIFGLCFILYFSALFYFHRFFWPWSILAVCFQRREEVAVPIPFRITLYLMVFILVYALDIVAFFSVDHPPLLLSIALNTLFNSQGLWNCLVYGFTTRQVRQYYTWQSGVFYGIFSPVILPFYVIRELTSSCDWPSFQKQLTRSNVNDCIRTSDSYGSV